MSVTNDQPTTSFARRVISGTVQLTVSNGVVRLLSVFTMPILTRLLNPKAYGVATLVGSIISLVSVFALAGIDMSYARAYHSVQPPNGDVVERYCWRYAITAAMIFSILTASAWWFFSKYSDELDSSLAIFLALGTMLSVGQTMAQVRARLTGSYRTMSVALIIGGIASATTSIGIAFWWRQDAMALLLSMLIAYLIPLLILGVPSITKMAKPSGLSRNEGVSLIKIGLAGIVTAPMYWLLSSSDRWFLQHYHGAESVGIYSIGYSVAIVGMMVNNAIMSVWLPEASREYEQDPAQAQIILGRLMSRLVTAMTLIWLMVTASGGDIVRWLANTRFHAAADYVPFIAGGVFFYGVLHLSNTGLLLTKRLNLAVFWWFIGGIVCVLLNMALVPRYGGVGAAITQTASFAFISIAILITSQSKFCIRLEWKRLAAVMSIILAAGFVAIPAWHQKALFSLLMKFPFGFMVAVIVAWFMTPDWCIRFAKYMKRICFIFSKQEVLH
jgi:O-antigen/teichoic acid export membrane protein